MNVLMGCNSANKQDSNFTGTDASKKTVSVVKSPIPGLDIPYQRLEVDPTRDTTFTLEDGSILHIPDHAFLDSSGNPVSSKVQIRVRTFHDAVDVLVAGIPMDYGPNSLHKVLRTAGMVDFTVRSNGQLLQPNPQSLCSITMQGQIDTSYHAFQLDTLTGEWKKVGEVLKTKLDKHPDSRRFSAKPESSNHSLVPFEPIVVGPNSFQLEGPVSFSNERLSKFFDNDESVFFDPIDKKFCGVERPSKVRIVYKGLGLFRVHFYKRGEKYIDSTYCDCRLAFHSGLEFERGKEVFAKLIAKERFGINPSKFNSDPVPVPSSLEEVGASFQMYLSRSGIHNCDKIEVITPYPHFSFLDLAPEVWIKSDNKATIFSKLEQNNPRQKIYLLNERNKGLLVAVKSFECLGMAPIPQLRVVGVDDQEAMYLCNHRLLKKSMQLGQSKDTLYFSVAKFQRLEDLKNQIFLEEVQNPLRK